MLFSIDIYYSFRSPYCYLINDRLAELVRCWNVSINLRPVYPLAIRDPDFFKKSDPLRRAYHLMDSARVASFMGIPYRRPVPDPVVSDLDKDIFSSEQPYITPVTRMAAAASRNGDGFRFANAMMKIMWDGSTDNWHNTENLKQAVGIAGLNWEKIVKLHRDSESLLEEDIMHNQESQRKAGHWGVPLMVYEGEPFYGQDRFPELIWKMKNNGLEKRN